MTDSTDEKFNIVGLVVNCTPSTQENSLVEINKIPGVEVHAADNGRVATTIDEVECEQPLVDTITQINNIKGVLSTSIAYHHFEGMGNQPSMMPANQEKSL